MEPKPPARQGQRANGQKLTRRRFPLSCNACRTRKLKCDRKTPCSNCLLRGADRTACSYAEKGNVKSLKHSHPEKTEMQNRIRRLESSILSLMAEKNEQESLSLSTKHGTISPLASNYSDTSESQNMPASIKGKHWDSILHEIGSMKEAWTEGNDQSSSHIESSPSLARGIRPSLLGGLTKPSDRSRISADLPNRNTCDQLIQHFFDFHSPAIPAKFTLHKATFLKQYNMHWADPEKTTIIWIGLLFAVICISVNTYIRLTDVTEAPLEYQDNLEAVAELFRVRTVECLIHADITKTQDLLLETLILHSHVEYTSENEGSKESMLLFSMIARLAVTQGYHRDPEQHSNLTVFQAEMRRRVWDVMNQYELCFSAQYGIPKIIRYAEVDTKPVSNLHEHELFEEMSVLPPSKPISEKTEIGYQIVICEVMRGYGRVIEFLHLVAPQPYEAVMKLDESLMKMREEVPAHLHLKSLQEMHGDASHVILERYVIQQFYHKSICVLHRKYWNVASLEPGGLYSRFTCVASAISLLDLQATMHEASVPGGLLEKIKWYHFSIANHDFLLAAMILSLDLVCEQKSVDEEAAKTTYLSWATPSEKILTLKRSLAVWTDVAEECSDAKRAIHIFNAVLKELRSKPEYSQFFSPQPDPLPSLTAVQKDPAAGSAQPENAGQWNTDPFFQKQFSISVPGTGIPGNEDTVAASENFNGNSLALDGGLWEAFGTDMDLPTDFDWEAWDQFINGNVAQPPISLD